MKAPASANGRRRGKRRSRKITIASTVQLPTSSAVQEPITPSPAPEVLRIQYPFYGGDREPWCALAADIEREDKEVISRENMDMDKVRAWIAREMKRADANIRGDIAAINKVESETLEDYMGKDYDEDDDLDGEEEDDDCEDEDDCEEYSDDNEAFKSYDLSDLEGDGGFLCAVICDFLCDHPRSLDQFWDRDITEQVLAACGKCHRVSHRISNYLFEAVVKYAKDKVPNGKDTKLIDLRGLYSEDAQKTLRTHLFRLSRQCHSSLKYLNVIVGCTLHGIGEGKLRQAVIALLMSDRTLKWTEGCEGAIISINLESSFGRAASYFDVADERTDLEEKVEADAEEKPDLCTVICDFLCNLPTDQRHDPEITIKVLAALQNCCGGGGESNVFVDANTMVIDVRGLYYVDAENMLMDNLNKFSCDSTIKYLNVIVGCMKHGIGEAHDGGKRNLWATVTCMLMHDETIKWVGYDLGAVISIELDGRKDYSNLRSILVDEALTG